MSAFLFFLIVGSKIADIEKSDISDREKLKIKDELLQDYSVKSERVHTMTQLLKAWTLFDRDTEYIVVDNKVKIVDEQTGRVLEGRRYSDGLHQAIEAKEMLRWKSATQTYATITCRIISGCTTSWQGWTGTAGNRSRRTLENL